MAIDEANDIQIKNLNVPNENIDEQVIDFENDGDREDDSILFDEATEKTETTFIDEKTEKDLTILSNLSGEMNLPTGKKAKLDIEPDDKFTIVKDSSGNEHVVRKSFICWLLNHQKAKLSSDRVERVIKNLGLSKAFIAFSSIKFR